MLATYSRRIYYADVDATGVLYHSHYLRLMEEARTEWLFSVGYHYARLHQENIAFLVRSAKIDYLRPAKLSDIITVSTQIESYSGASMMFKQTVTLDGQRLTEGHIHLVCVNWKNQPCAIPQALVAHLSA